MHFSADVRNRGQKIFLSTGGHSVTVKHTHTQKHIQIHTHTQTGTGAKTPSNAVVCAHAQNSPTYTHTYRVTHTCMHTHTHTDTCTRRHTHTHTHTSGVQPTASILRQLLRPWWPRPPASTAMTQNSAKSTTALTLFSKAENHTGGMR